MTPECAQELLDLIMMDEFVARRKALDRWTQRWVTTLHVEVRHMLNGVADLRDKQAQDELAREMLKGILRAGTLVLALYHPEREGGPNKAVICADLNVLKQRPEVIQ